MRIKFERKVELTQKQIFELATLLKRPDMGWKYDSQNNPIQLTNNQYYDAMLSGDYANYEYRVNLSYELITVKSVYTKR